MNETCYCTSLLAYLHAQIRLTNAAIGFANMRHLSILSRAHAFGIRRAFRPIACGNTAIRGFMLPIPLIALVVSLGACGAHLIQKKITRKQAEKWKDKTINITNINVPPLIQAMRDNEIAAARLLIDQGADVNGRMPDGTPFITEILKTRLKQSMQNDKTYLDNEWLNLFIESGADVNAMDRNCRSPIFFARNESDVRTLVHASAEVNAQDAEGITPLHCADNSEVLLALLNFKANLLLCDSQGRTPLMMALKDDRQSVISAILNQHQNYNAHDNTGKNALFYCANPKWISQLIRCDVKINHRDEDGRTALFYAQTPELALELISSGATLNIVDNKGLSPYAFLQNPQCIWTIFSKSAQCNQNDLPLIFNAAKQASIPEIDNKLKLLTKAFSDRFSLSIMTKFLKKAANDSDLDLFKWTIAFTKCLHPDYLKKLDSVMLYLTSIPDPQYLDLIMQEGYSFYPPSEKHSGAPFSKYSKSPTLLMEAIANMNLPVIEYLLQKAEDLISYSTNQGGIIISPAYIALQTQQFELFKKLYKKEQQNTIYLSYNYFRLALDQSLPDEIIKYSAKDLDINEKNFIWLPYEGLLSPLEYAVKIQSEKVNLLLSIGANKTELKPRYAKQLEYYLTNHTWQDTRKSPQKKKKAKMGSSAPANSDMSGHNVSAQAHSRNASNRSR